ncbi:MAG TPA: HPr kinase/phosphatase C-terminal domain-containing protein [Rhizomicrobium sp.]
MNIHATCIRIGRAGKDLGAPASAGVLLLGPSGAGKSDLALRLIARGARLVSDDRTDLAVVHGRLVADAPARLAGLLEVRGVGIVKLPHVGRVTVALVVELSAKVPRLPDDRTFSPLNLVLKIYPPLICINPFEASACDKVLVAALAHVRRRRVL